MTRTISLSSITVPVLVFAGATDGIAPMPSVQALVPLLTGSRETAFEIVPGGHLGLLTGRAARTATWPVIDEWVDRWTAAAVVPPPAKKPARKRAAAKKATPSKKATATKKTAKKTAEPEIGTNPQRRYGSASSRSLGR